jgi:hypothetical protein
VPFQRFPNGNCGCSRPVRKSAMSETYCPPASSGLIQLLSNLLTPTIPAGRSKNVAVCVPKCAPDNRIKRISKYHQEQN